MNRHFSKYGLVGALLCCWSPSSVWSQPAKTQTPQDLCARALSAKKLEERANAAVELAMLKGPAALPQLRRLADMTKDAEVLLPTLAGLIVRNDADSLPRFVAALENKEENVRGIAIQGVLQVTGMSADDVGFKADDPAEDRAKAVARLQGLLKKGKAKSAP